MSNKSPSPQHQFAFAADWESCDAMTTYRPPWKFAGTTPKALKLSPGRAYRVSVRPETTAADLAGILEAATRCNIRTVRIPHGGPITAAELGGELAKFAHVRQVGMACPYESTVWVASIARDDGGKLDFELDNWPVDDVAAALGRIPRADELVIRLGGYAKPFRLTPLFGIRGFTRIEVHHNSYAKQKLDWSGLSAQTALTKLQTDRGMLAEVFWKELGQLKKLREIGLSWPEDARATPGDMTRLSSLKNVDGSCLFDSVPAVFRALAECPALDDVRIDQCHLDDAMATEIGGLTRVKNLYIWNTELTNKQMQALCRWPKIKSLTLAEDSGKPAVTSVGLKSLGNLKTLETLHLQGFQGAAEDGWATLRQLTRLKQLKLSSNPTFDLLEAVGPLRSVEKLSLSQCNSIGPAGFQLLRDMPRLKTLRLDIHSYSPHYVPLAEVGQTKQLTSLYLRGLPKLTDDQLGHLAGLDNLEELWLNEAGKITDQGIAGLARLKQLRLFSLYGTPRLTDRALAALATFPRLEALLMRCTGKMTEKGFDSLAKARKLTALHLDYARHLTGECLLRLVRQLPLEELSVASSPHLTDEDVMELAKHPTLKRVSINQCKNVSEEGLKALAAARPEWTQPTCGFWGSP